MLFIISSTLQCVTVLGLGSHGHRALPCTFDKTTVCGMVSADCGGVRSMIQLLSAAEQGFLSACATGDLEGVQAYCAYNPPAVFNGEGFALAVEHNQHSILNFLLAQPRTVSVALALKRALAGGNSELVDLLWPLVDHCAELATKSSPSNSVSCWMTAIVHGYYSKALDVDCDHNNCIDEALSVLSQSKSTSEEYRNLVVRLFEHTGAPEYIHILLPRKKIPNPYFFSLVLKGALSGGDLVWERVLDGDDGTCTAALYGEFKNEFMNLSADMQCSVLAKLLPEHYTLAQDAFKHLSGSSFQEDVVCCVLAHEYLLEVFCAVWEKDPLFPHETAHTVTRKIARQSYDCPAQMLRLWERLPCTYHVSGVWGIACAKNDDYMKRLFALLDNDGIARVREELAGSNNNSKNVGLNFFDEYCNKVQRAHLIDAISAVELERCGVGIKEPRKM